MSSTVLRPATGIGLLLQALLGTAFATLSEGGRAGKDPAGGLGFGLMLVLGITVFVLHRRSNLSRFLKYNLALLFVSASWLVLSVSLARHSTFGFGFFLEHKLSSAFWIYAIGRGNYLVPAIVALLSQGIVYFGFRWLAASDPHDSSEHRLRRFYGALIKLGPLTFLLWFLGWILAFTPALAFVMLYATARLHVIELLRPRPILYLRSFGAEGAADVFGRLIAPAAKHLGTIVGLSHRLQPAAKVHNRTHMAFQAELHEVPDDQWQSWVRRELERCLAAVFDLGASSPGVVWELEEAQRLLSDGAIVILVPEGSGTVPGLEHRTVFYPADKKSLPKVRREVVAALTAAGPLHGMQPSKASDVLAVAVAIALSVTSFSVILHLAETDIADAESWSRPCVRYRHVASCLELLDGYRNGCESRNEIACYELVRNDYLMGMACRSAQRGDEAVSQTCQSFVSIYETACDKGLQEACVSYAGVLRFGNGVPRDEQRARRLLESACKAGFHEGCIALHGQLASGTDDDQARARSVKEATLVDLAKQCEARPFACYELANLHDRSGDLQGQAEAKRLFRRACDGGYEDACQALELRAYRASESR